MSVTGSIDNLRILTVCSAAALAACAPDWSSRLEADLRARIAESGAETVGLYFHALDRGDTVAIDADVALHAASMMKVPVMIQLFRDVDSGRLSLGRTLEVTDTFHSIVDGSPYRLSSGDDSDSTLYARLGEPVPLGELAEAMITVSSNLAANMLVEFLGAERIQKTAEALGVRSTIVLGGFEDIKAYEAGLSNRASARDLGLLFEAIAEGTAASATSCSAMLRILERQAFNDGIPAGLPSSARVAHKTGRITAINHDGGLVRLEDGRHYVLVVLTRGLEDPAASDRLIADLSRLVYEAVAGQAR